MKKYVKPELVYESFELSQQIAACDFDSENSQTDISNCYFEGTHPMTGAPVKFFTTEGVCEMKFEGYCEYVSISSMLNLFNS